MTKLEFYKFVNAVLPQIEEDDRYYFFQAMNEKFDLTEKKNYLIKWLKLHNYKILE